MVDWLRCIDSNTGKELSEIVGRVGRRNPPSSDEIKTMNFLDTTSMYLFDGRLFHPRFSVWQERATSVGS